ncbi:MAG: hypothetical protein ACLP22_09555 [Solirubrobacteraceae bacterium]
MRRLIAAVALVVVVVLAAVGIHSCQVTQTDNSLKDYNTSVRQLIEQSNATGDNVFRLLSQGASASNEEQLTMQLNNAAEHAADQLAQAGSLSVPGQMQKAQQDLLLTLQMRHDAITTIAKQVEPAVGNTTREEALDTIAGASAQFYASDVVYKSYVLPGIGGALQAAGIAVGGVNGEVMDEGQVLSDLGWLAPSFVATKLGTPIASSGSSHPFVAGLHGHSLNSVSVAGTALSPTPASNASIPSSPPPTFTLSITNGGDFNEYSVVCKVTVTGLSDSGSYTIPETFAGQGSSCPVKLPSAPTPGTYQVTAEVMPVEGETNVANNTLTFSITFS